MNRNEYHGMDRCSESIIKEEGEKKILHEKCIISYILHVAQAQYYYYTLYTHIFTVNRNPLEISIAYSHSTDTKFLFRSYVHKNTAQRIHFEKWIAETGKN